MENIPVKWKINLKIYLINIENGNLPLLKCKQTFRDTAK